MGIVTILVLEVQGSVNSTAWQEVLVKWTVNKDMSRDLVETDLILHCLTKLCWNFLIYSTVVEVSILPHTASSPTLLGQQDR